MPRIDGIRCVSFLLVQLCCMSITQAIYDNVKVKIRNGDEIIELNWKRSEQFVANKNLPIWFAEYRREPRLLSHIMEKIGDFITYQDTEKSSAVVYFKKFRCFHGVIDSRFYVFQLPLDKITPGEYLEVDNVHIVARGENEGYFHDNENNWLSNFFTDDQLQLISSVLDSSMEISPAEQQNDIMQHASVFNVPLDEDQNLQQNVATVHQPGTTILYPEILIFITHDVYENFIRSHLEEGIAGLVLYYIVYFNAINMLFAKLATENIAIHINMAGLVIESEDAVFPYSTEFITRPDGSSYHRFRDGVFSLNFATYIRRYQNIFPADSFDFFFVATNYRIQKNGETIHGVSSPKGSFYRQRSVNRPYEYVLGSLVRRQKFFGDYISASRQIAKLMDIEHDPRTNGLHYNGKQCFAIMQNSKSYCRNCLAWSDSSRNDLMTFVRDNKNHCFLMNPPRSLQPYGRPMFSMNPEHQCLCYGFPADTLDIFYLLMVPEDACKKPMRCSINQDFQTFIPPPIDGTPCSRFSNKFCWRGECVEAGQQ